MTQRFISGSTVFISQSLARMFQLLNNRTLVPSPNNPQFHFETFVFYQRVKPSGYVGANFISTLLPGSLRLSIRLQFLVIDNRNHRGFDLKPGNSAKQQTLQTSAARNKCQRSAGCRVPCSDVAADCVRIPKLQLREMKLGRCMFA